MSTTLTEQRTTAAAPRTTPAGRLGALARTELTLLGRAKGTLFTALVVPLILPFTVQATVKESTLEGTGVKVGEVLLTAAVGFSLLFAVYAALVTIFVVRREELVFKRLRTGELRDPEILAGAALPSVLIGFAQCVVVTAGATVLLDLGAPKAVWWALAGVLLGLVLSVALAAVTAGISKTAESAQVMALPLMFVSMIGSGMTVPLEVFPDRVASVLELLPLSPVITLVRGGWSGELTAGEGLMALAVAVAWILLGVFAVRRWFRWEPRR
ncbi:ABC transporter permease [Streptomyces sp. TRM66268-LWL]|uniref:Transport permease protein n=1 Tax=Streptomyces polyasparticus TaxID=2767826 RepID=A0ABR7SXN8_9ACTN|nr:ABC transporter permease [Streptomyces polyasparticus]MBC9719113.1 ABC transporter permease [Streptomyces polyasparticus]